MNPFAMLDLGRMLAYGAVVIAAGTTIYIYGYSRGERKLFEYQAEQARAAVPVVVKQGKVTQQIVTRYRDRVVAIEGETQFIEKEIIVYVPASADCVLPRGWVQLHDAAALGAVPGAAPGADGDAPGIAASQALKGVIENYGACRKTTQQLLDLQDWVAHQYRVMNEPHQ